MQVILLERVENLGHIGDEVKVKDGFARNFLLPKNKALRATDSNRKAFEARRADIEAKNAERRSEAEVSSKELDGMTFVVIRQASETGQLYGSVSTRDIADAATEAGANVQRTQVKLDKPLKTLGLFPVRIILHPEVSAEVTINIARSADEAERQARGEDVLARVDEIDEDEAEETAEADAETPEGEEAATSEEADQTA